MIGKNRVVITGMGVLAANGIGKEAFWNSLLAGESGIGPITLFDATDFKSRIAGEVSDFEPENYMDGRIKARRLSRNVQLGVKAAMMAVADSGLTGQDLQNAAPICINIGISLGGFDHIENQIRRVVSMGPNKLVPHAVEGCIHLAAASLIGAILNVETELNTISNSCVGGMDSIGYGSRLIQSGKADICLCGGTEAPIVPSALAGFCAAGMVSTNNENPQRASRPFDLNRDGGVLAEGSGMLVLESLEHALVRNAHIYAEVYGYGTARDLNHFRSGNGLALSMEKALNNAATRVEEIDAVFAHGPSDQVLDTSESIYLSQVLGKVAREIPTTSIKAVTGNPLAAGGAHQVIGAMLALETQIIPPTANLVTIDPECELDYVPEGPRMVAVDKVLINSHGSGAMNSSLIVGRVGDL